MVRGYDSSAHADVSHGALRVLRVSLEGHRLYQLRPAVRPARRAVARPRRRAALAQGRRRLPQHGVQRAGADRRGVCFTPARTGGKDVPDRVPERNAGAGGADHREISSIVAWRNHRRAALARIEIAESTRRDARADGVNRKFVPQTYRRSELTIVLP